MVEHPPKANAKPASRRGDRLHNIVIAGEFNAGKSSVIDLLMQRSLLPVSAKFTDWPLVRVLPAQTEYWEQDLGAGAGNTLTPGATPGERAQRVDIGVPDIPFEGAAILEIPIDRTGRMTPAARSAFESADVLVWCTMAQRAWSLSEIQIVSSLPEALKRRSVLAITRSDYLRSDDARQKVLERVTRQASKYFAQIVLINASHEAVTHAGKNDRSGRPELCKAIADLLADISANKPSGDVIAFGTRVDTPAEVAVQWCKRMQDLMRLLSRMDAATSAEELTRLMVETVKAAQAEVHKNSVDADEMSDIAKMFDRVSEALIDVSCGRTAQSAALRSADLLFQIERELAISSGQPNASAAGDHGDIALFHHQPLHFAQEGELRKAN